MKGIESMKTGASDKNIVSGFRSCYIHPRSRPTEEEISDTFRYLVNQGQIEIDGETVAQHRANCHSPYRLLTSLECIRHYAHVHGLTQQAIDQLVLGLEDLPLIIR